MLDQQQPMDSAEHKSSEHAPTQDNPLKTFYNSKVKQLHVKAESGSTANKKVSSSSAATSSGTSSNVTMFHNNNNNNNTVSNVKPNYVSTASNSYSIDNILSKCTTNSGDNKSSISSSFGAHENAKTTGALVSNPHDDVGQPMPSLELSLHKEPIKTYQPLIYYPNRCSSGYVVKDCLDSRAPNVGSVHAVTNGNTCAYLPVVLIWFSSSEWWYNWRRRPPLLHSTPAFLPTNCRWHCDQFVNCVV